MLLFGGCPSKSALVKVQTVTETLMSFYGGCLCKIELSR